VLLFQRLGLGTVLGFVLAGALVLPWGLGFIVTVDEIRHLTQFGVVFLLRPIIQVTVGSRRNPEIFTAPGILLVLGAAWLADRADLSMTLGAFLGGLLLANFRYRHQIIADI